MRKKRSLIIALLILTFPGIFIAVTHCGNPKSKVDPLNFYHVENAGSGPDTLNRSVGDFRFKNQDGEWITADHYKGSVWVANVFFSTCQVTCPRLMAEMQKVQSKFLNDDAVKFLSITVDPETDSVARLKVYGDSIGAIKSKWNLITGQRNELYQMAMNQFLFKALKTDSGVVKFIHDNSLRLIDKEGMLRGETYEPLSRGGIDKVIEDIERLQLEYKTAR